MIHETAIIDSSVKLEKNVAIGPYSIIGPDVEIGEGTIIESHVVIRKNTKLGKNNHIFQFSSVGEDPQDKKYMGEKTFLEIGDNNIIREFCTFNRGTGKGGGITKIGHDNLFMAYVHVAHDCIIHNHTVFANNASLAGHVEIDDYVGLGGFSAVHQFCRMGAYSFAAGGSLIGHDVPPYVRVSGHFAKPFGLNSVGLTRNGFTPERIAEIKKMYRVVYREGLGTVEAIAKLKETFPDDFDANYFIEILQHSERGVVR